MCQYILLSKRITLVFTITFKFEKKKRSRTLVLVLQRVLYSLNKKILENIFDN